jgi:hypothetical protein
MPPTAERARLIAEVVAFVRAAQRLPGIRINLSKSLSTSVGAREVGSGREGLYGIESRK